MSSPGQDPDLDPAVARLLERDVPKVRSEPSLLRDPARVLVVLGAIVAIVASPLPWLVKVGSPPPRTMTGWSGLFDGFLIAVVAGALVWLVLNRDVARSRMWLMRWLPPILGATAILLGISALRNMENQIEIWSIEGATGDYQPWLYVCLGGVAIIAVGTLLLAVRLLREPAAIGTSARTIAIPRSTIAWVVFGTVGGVIGVAAAATLIIGLDFDPVAVSLPLLLGTILGGIVGAYLGARLARGIGASR